jgi:hypothetical protein
LVVTLPEHLRTRVLDAARRAPVPTRPETQAQHTALLVAAIASSLVVFVASGGARPTERPYELMVQTALGALCVAAIAVLLGLRRGTTMLGRPALVLIGLSLLAPLALLAWKFGVSSGYPGMTRVWPERIGFRCLRLGLLTASFPFAAMIAIRRRSDPAHPRLTGAAIGTAVGTASWFLVDLWCPVANVPHLLLGHVLPLVLLTITGAVLGGRLIAVRAD